MEAHFELDGRSCLLLDDGCAVSNGRAADQIADLDFCDVAAAAFAVDREVEQRANPQSSVLIEKEPDSPDVARLQGRSELERPAIRFFLNC